MQKWPKINLIKSKFGPDGIVKNLIHCYSELFKYHFQNTLLQIDYVIIKW